jgi:hypothetical protein
MALTFMNRSAQPAPPSKGKIATKATVLVGANGSITFNSLASKLLEGSSAVGLAYDGKTRVVAIFPQGHAKIAKQDAGTLFAVKKGKKSKSFSMANAAWILNTVLPEPHYDYKASGNQTFDITEKDGVLMFTLPEKATPKPTVARAPRKKKESSVRAEVGTGVALGVAAGVGAAESDDLILDPA